MALLTVFMRFMRKTLPPTLSDIHFHSVLFNLSRKNVIIKNDQTSHGASDLQRSHLNCIKLHFGTFKGWARRIFLTSRTRCFYRSEERLLIIKTSDSYQV